MFGFTQFLPTGPAFPQCTACSSPVIQLFKVLISIAFSSPISQSTVGRVLSFFSPHPQASVPHPPEPGGSHTLGGVQIPTRRHTLCYFVTNSVTPEPFFSVFLLVPKTRTSVADPYSDPLHFSEAGSRSGSMLKAGSRSGSASKNVKTRSCGGSKS